MKNSIPSGVASVAAAPVAPRVLEYGSANPATHALLLRIEVLPRGFEVGYE